jgi:hypothetical protein
MLIFYSLTKWSHPPKDLLSKSAGNLEKLVAAANLQKGKFIHNDPHLQHLTQPFSAPESQGQTWTP